MTKKPAAIGTIVNKLERNIALANMRGDRVASETFRTMLAAAVNGTQMPKVCS